MHFPILIQLALVMNEGRKRSRSFGEKPQENIEETAESKQLAQELLSVLKRQLIHFQFQQGKITDLNKALEEAGFGSKIEKPGANQK